MSTQSLRPANAKSSQLQRLLDAVKNEMSAAAARKVRGLKRLYRGAPHRIPKRKINCAHRIPIAPGIALTTQEGSLYTTVLKIVAALGDLDQHDLL